MKTYAKIDLSRLASLQLPKLNVLIVLCTGHVTLRAPALCIFTPYQDDTLGTSTGEHPHAIMNTVTKSTHTLKDLRLREGITQHDVATALNIRAQTVSLWERGIKEPRLSIPQTLTLCRLYNCTLEELYDTLEQTNRLIDSNRLLVAS
jgi:DNA-binding XRE family transcriptional regulator